MQGTCHKLYQRCLVPSENRHLTGLRRGRSHTPPPSQPQGDRPRACWTRPASLSILARMSTAFTGSHTASLLGLAGRHSNAATRASLSHFLLRRYRHRRRHARRLLGRRPAALNPHRFTTCQSVVTSLKKPESPAFAIWERAAAAVARYKQWHPHQRIGQAVVQERGGWHPTTPRSSRTGAC